MLNLVNVTPTTYTFEDFTASATAASTTIGFAGTAPTGGGGWRALLGSHRFQRDSIGDELTRSRYYLLLALLYEFGITRPATA